MTGSLKMSSIRNMKTMSSTQLGELLHFKSKKALHRAIRNMFKVKIDGAVIAPSLNTNGTVDEYWLPELESKMFVAKHDIEYLEIITQFWIDRNKPQLPDFTNPAIAARAWADECEGRLLAEHTNLLLRAEITEDLPLTDLGRVVIKSDTTVTVEEFAKLMGIKGLGRNKMFNFLRQQQILMATPTSQPYQKYINDGWFELAVKDSDHRTHNQTLITGKGMNKLRMVLVEFYPEVGGLVV